MTRLPDGKKERRLGLMVSLPPHIHVREGTGAIMFDVVVALLPALAVAVYFFGLRVMTLSLVSVCTCVVLELGYQTLLKKPVTAWDGSAVVTGLLLAMCLPVSISYGLLLLGDAFAILVVKQLYGGIGRNVFNPALCARAFLCSFPVQMSTFTGPTAYIPVWGSTDADAIACATPLSSLQAGKLPAEPLRYLFVGMTGGSMGETCALLLLLGGAFLMLRHVISPRIPLSYLGTVALLTFLFPMGNDPKMWMLCQLFSGGLMLGAIFMATDYTTSPVTHGGQIAYGIGCGVITVLIRYFGAYPEGVCYAILIMNAFAWLLDRALRPRRLGGRLRGLLKHKTGVRP